MICNFVGDFVMTHYFCKVTSHLQPFKFTIFKSQIHKSTTKSHIAIANMFFQMNEDVKVINTFLTPAKQNEVNDSDKGFFDVFCDPYSNEDVDIGFFNFSRDSYSNEDVDIEVFKAFCDLYSNVNEFEQIDQESNVGHPSEVQKELDETKVKTLYLAFIYTLYSF